MAGNREEDEEPRSVVSQGRLRKRRKDGWSRRDETVFLTHLRATGNISASARAAGKSPSSAHDLYDRDSIFAGGWDEALRHCRLRLHAKLILFTETGGKEVSAGDDGEPGEASMADFDPDLTLRVLKYLADCETGARRGRQPPLQASEEEVTAALLRNLDALDRRLKRRKI
jgi:hypothetical protein